MNRDDRYIQEKTSTDQRDSFQRDRDRIIYSSAFRRLAGVTQVVGSGEGHPFHNRLTHTLKVGQVARRLAELRMRDQPDLAQQLGVDPEVTEAAALAHDLGHPPFGHVGEDLLHSKACEVSGKNADGFEGNAQTFRVVTRLAVHRSGRDGLNLTRATLNAILKYPWVHNSRHPKRKKKWGAYKSEQVFLKFARAGFPDESKSAEAELMDWADDIAYSVHDVEDFYRAGLLPLGRLARLADEIEPLCTIAARDIVPRKGKTGVDLAHDACERVFSYVNEDLYSEYKGSRTQRGHLRWLTSFLVGQYVRAVKLRKPTSTNPSRITIDPAAFEEVQVLKALMRHYIFSNPALAAQQEGQRRILSDLFDIMYEAALGKRNRDLLPQSVRELLDESTGDKKTLNVRAVVDSISSMTEEEAYRLHQRLTGMHVGRVGDPIVR